MPSVKVLLADDHVVVRAGLRNALEGLPNIEIAGEVGNGRELMGALAHINPDLLVLDANMPDFEPIPAVRQMKAERPQMKILIVSAHDDEAYVVGLLNAGVDGYHMKDQPLADLQLATQRILNGERWISSRLVGRLAQVHSTPASTGSPWLTRRQRELLRLLTQGLDNRHIAQHLDLSVKTVENHLTALYRVLGVDSRLKALHYALRHPELLAISGQEVLELEPRQQKNHYELTVLVVDDNTRYRQQLTHLIGKIRPTSILYEAGNIAEAVKLGQQVRPQLALIDVVLEDEDGIQCARQLRSVSPSTRMVVVSAYPDRGFRKQALSAGAVAFVDKKDLDTASLRQVIEDALR
ncbi:MAG TPA: response regulator [Anaerolineales bacterium]|nr:response regulator [Anaerolineales bacterium]